ncbi:MAG: penicillin-binding protein activator, partial [Alphaproteobacteria bacterium]|nr:penicillin-binding protein activator [Alphaproteobacteria bacterium]
PVALLLPLSGNAAPIGKSMQNAAQLALFELPDAALRLQFYDTGGDAPRARAAVETAVKGGARLILGPLFANEVVEAGPVARQAGVNVIAFTNTRTVAAPGTYILGLVPRQQVGRVVAYASGQGLKRFAALVPATAFGRQVTDDMREAAAAAGGTVARIESYAADQRDVDAAVRRLLWLPPREAGTGDEDPGSRRAAAAAPVVEPGFDALLIPESGERLQAIAALLASYGVDPARVRLLSIAAWQDPGLGRAAALVGAWFAAPPPESVGDFQGRYRGTFGADPHPLASLAYDATALAVVLGRAPGGPSYDAAALNGPNGFMGASGVFRLLPTGEGQRGLAVLEVERAAFRIVSPAPESFADLGN